MQNKPETIQTERLVLKSFSDEDFAPIMAIFRDERVSATYMVPELKTEEEQQWMFSKLKELSCDPARFEYGVYCDNRLIGFVNDCDIEGTMIEIGYAISPDEWGKGYATEVLNASIQALFAMGYERIRAGYFENNEASHRVMLKCGLTDIEETEEDHYRGKTYLCRNCEITKEQYDAEN